MINNLDIEIYDLLDLISFTLSKEFIDKWRFKYGERLIKLYQIKILDALKNSKNIKLKNLIRFLEKDSGFSIETISSFMNDVDFELYYPIIQGSFRDLKGA